MSKIKVLHCNTWGGIGGAFLAADRLHQALLNSGVDSVFAYGKVLNNSEENIKNSNAYRKLPINNNKFERLSIRFLKKIGFNDLGNFSAFLYKDKDYFSQANVINFHNLHSDYFSYIALPKLTKNKPAVWTLHDMWSFTGHCAYSYDCSKWQTGCGKCPYPESQPAIRRDVTDLEWKLKNWVYNHSNLTIVAPSRWLTDLAKQSILNCFPIYHIPYSIDTEAFQPLDPHQCRFLLGIPTGKKVLMFGAQIVKDPRKGGDLLIKALSCLPESLKTETVLLTIGEGGEAISQAAGIATVNLGYLSNDRLKSIAYSAADLFVFPTRADNLPLMLQESMACATPMVSFEVGGVPDLVRPGVTGYLAQPENAQDLGNGIVQLLEDETLREQMSQNCRAIALEEYPIQLQAQRYLQLYRQLVK